MELGNYAGIQKQNINFSFELGPVGKTREFLSKHKVIENDYNMWGMSSQLEIIGQHYINDFIDFFANNYSYNWENAHKIFENVNGIKSFMKNPHIKDFIEKISRDILKAWKTYHEYLKELYDVDYSTEFDSKFVKNNLYHYVEKKDIDSIDTEYIVERINELASSFNITMEKIFENWKSILFGRGYTSLAYKYLENFYIFSKNISIYVNIYNSYPDVFIEQEKNLIGIEVLQSVKFYKVCMSPVWIERYNQLLTGYYNRNMKLYTGVNSVIEKISYDSGISFKKLKKLKTLFITNKDKKNNVNPIKNVDDFIKSVEQIFLIVDRLEETVSKFKKYLRESYHDNVFIRKDKLSYISNGIFSYPYYFDDNFVERTQGNTKNKLSDARSAYSIKELVSCVDMKLSIPLIMGWVEGELLQKLEQNHIDKENLKKNIDIDRKKTDYLSSDTILYVQQYLEGIIDLGNFLDIFNVNDECDMDYKGDYNFCKNLESALKFVSTIKKKYHDIKRYIIDRDIHNRDIRRDELILSFGRASHLSQSWSERNKGVFSNTDACIMRKDGQYYFLISSIAKTVKKQNRILLYDDPLKEPCYEVLTFNGGTDLKRNGPRLTFKSFYSKAMFGNGIESFDLPVGTGSIRITKKLADDYNEGLYKTDRKVLLEILTFYKEFIQLSPIYSHVRISDIKKLDEYESLGAFSDHIMLLSAYTCLRYMEKSVVDKQVSEGLLYLFKIKNQDMYRERRSSSDVTSIYFNQLFESAENGNISICINNDPKVIYRPRLLNTLITHPKDSFLVNKRDKNGNYIPADIYMQLTRYINGTTKNCSESAKKYLEDDLVAIKKADKDIVKDNRYTKERFRISCSYTIGYGVRKNIGINQLRNKVLKDFVDDNMNILTIRRGKNNFLCYVVMDQEGNRIEHGVWNKIGTTDFIGKLRTTSDAYTWQSGKKLDNFKKSYLTMVTSTIVKKAIQHNAVICIEQTEKKYKDYDNIINSDMFELFENNLLSKLSCYTDKNILDHEPGGILNPLHLAKKVKSREGNGILFKVSPSNTKGIDFENGYINLLNSNLGKKYSSKKRILKKMESIRIDWESKEINYEFRYSKLDVNIPKEILNEVKNKDTLISICAKGNRTYRDKITGRYVEISVASVIDELFRSSKIVSCDENRKGTLIDIEKINDDEVSFLYEIFILYAEGHIEAEDTFSSDCFVSPVTGQKICFNGAELDYDMINTFGFAYKCVSFFKNQLDRDNLVMNAPFKNSDWINIVLGKKYRWE